MNQQDKCRDCDQPATIYWADPAQRWCKDHQPPANWEPEPDPCRYPNCECDDFKPRCPGCGESWPCPRLPHVHDVNS